MTSGDSCAIEVHCESVPKRTACVRCGKGSEGVRKETLDDHACGLVVVEPSTHQVVELVIVDAGTGRTVCGRDVVGQHFEFGNRVGSSWRSSLLAQAVD